MAEKIFHDLFHSVTLCCGVDQKFLLHKQLLEFGRIPQNWCPMLELKNLQKSFAGEIVLRDVSLVVPQGELVSILGPSGCGKTTLLRILAGFEPPDSGTISWNNREITANSPNRRPFNMVFQRYALFPHLTVEGNVAFGPQLRRESAGEIRAKVRQALELVRLDGYGSRRIETLSGGQQQRVALARAIINNPQMLLLDEPMSALDKHLREKMRLDILTIQRKLGITFIMVTHDQEEAMAMSDRIAIMNHGAIEQVGTPEEIYRNPKTAFVAESIGSLNVFSHGGLTIHVRPEHIKVSKAASDRGNNGVCEARAVVKEILFKGPATQYVLEVEDVGNTSSIVHALSYGGHQAGEQIVVDDRIFIQWEQGSVLKLDPELQVLPK